MAFSPRYSLGLSEESWKSSTNGQLLHNLLSVPREDTFARRVWDSYVNLREELRGDYLPFAVYQDVLRRCVPLPKTMRLHAGSRQRNSHKIDTPHLYEHRLKDVIRDMRNAGHRPDLEDYHYVLEHLAAAGCKADAMSVWREMLKDGHGPKHRTYGLILQAIARRIALPYPFRFKDQLKREVGAACAEIMEDMRERGFHCSSINLDLFMRVIAWTGDTKAYLQMLRLGYGVDIDNPDRRPSEFIERFKTIQKVAAEQNTPVPPFPVFSTSALNTTIGVFGRAGDIIRMVVAFETLTAPLPDPNPSDQPLDGGRKRSQLYLRLNSQYYLRQR